MLRSHLMLCFISKLAHKNNVILDFFWQHTVFISYEYFRQHHQPIQTFVQFILIAVLTSLFFLALVEKYSLSASGTIATRQSLKLSD